MSHRQGWHQLEGSVVLIADENVDTDQIFPTRFLKLALADFGAALFGSRRYLDDDSREDPDFVLNRPAARGARILLCGRNFGCGSAREQAVWALRDFGFVALIAPSFSEIFRGNCARNGIAALTLAADDWQALTRMVSAADGTRVRVELVNATVQFDGQTLSCELPAPQRRMLIEGLDEVAQTMERVAAIERFEARDRRERPWVWLAARSGPDNS